MHLHRYLFTQYGQVFFLVLGSLITVVWLNQTLSLLELVVNKGAPLFDFLILSVLATPLWLLEAIPIAFFIAILWVIHKSQSDRELVVMQAIGLSEKQFSYAPVILAVCLTVFQLFNSLYFLPQSFGEFKLRQTELRNAIPRILLQDRVFVDIAPGLTMHINERASSNEVLNIFIQDAREKDNIATLTAAKGTFDFEDGRPVLILENGERSELTSGNEAGASLLFQQYKLYFSLSRVTSSQSRTVDMNEDSISNLFNPSKAINEAYVSQRAAYGHYRITSPFLTLCLTLIALAILTRGRLRDDAKQNRMWLAVCAALGIEVLFITARSLTVSFPAVWPLIYFTLLIPSIISVYLLMGRSLTLFRRSAI